jgi:hypothetical protein
MRNLLPSLIVALLVTGCTDVEHDHDHDHDHEVLTTVILNFTDDAAGTTESFEWADPEDDGDPVIDAILLTDGSSYTLDVELWNELEDPAEDVTSEIGDEADEHQFFFTGSAVQGPATGTNDEAIVEHSYDDDDGVLPLGLENSVTTLGMGSGEFVVTLRHLPEENGAAVKVAGLAEDVAAGGFGSIGGANDIQVTFDLTVQ